MVNKTYNAITSSGVNAIFISLKLSLKENRNSSKKYKRSQHSLRNSRTITNVLITSYRLPEPDFPLTYTVANPLKSMKLQ